jgi:DNA-binding NarL/FixJ family response regulator
MAFRVVLIDDHPLFREGLRNLLALRHDLEVAAEGSNGNEAIEIARQLRPDMIVMDITMPGMDGLEATRRIKAEMPEVRILIVTASEDEQDLFAAVKAGAQGYLLKSHPSSEILDLIVSAAAGEAAFTPGLASKTLLALGASERGPGERLTPREKEVLEQLVRGLSNLTIANNLGLNESTVRFHLRNILSKLHVQNRTEAAVEALKQRIVRPS